MFNVIRMRLAQIADMASLGGWNSVFKEMFFLNRTAVVVEKQLSEISDRKGPLESSNLQVVEIDKTLLARPYEFALKSRHLKTMNNLGLGYGGMALVRGNTIVGDTWYWIPAPNAPLHIDLRRFGINAWSERNVYTFDIFVAPSERKSGISAAFQNRAMLMLRAKGYTRAFGFYWADNIPAHWCTRVTNKWKKIRDVRVCRFLTWTRSVPLSEEPPQVARAASGSEARLQPETKEDTKHARTADEDTERVQIGV